MEYECDTEDCKNEAEHELNDKMICTDCYSQLVDRDYETVLEFQITEDGKKFLKELKHKQLEGESK